jgi:enoyl-CoA hydratase
MKLLFLAHPHELAMSSPLLDVTREGELAIATLNRPPVNALTIEFCEAIADRFTELAGPAAAKAGVKAVVLAGGNGTAFCAGLDLKLVPTYGPAQQDRLITALNRAFHAVYACPLPVVVAINGHCIAGGMVLALCGDYRLMAGGPLAGNPRLGLTEVKVGVPYPVGALEVCRAELRPEVARQVMLFGELVDVGQALALGLVDEPVAPTLMALRARELAAQLGALPASAYSRVKRQLRAPALERIEAALAADNDPVKGRWLSGETAAAATGVLHGKGRN